MAVGFKFDCFFYQVGHGDFLHSFFSTISYYLEPSGWGTIYPKLLNDLCYNKLNHSDIPLAIKETEEVRRRLQDFLPSQVIWDIDDLAAEPPWGDNISDDITNLSNYFITSDGQDLFDLLLEALNDAYEDKFDLVIVSI